LYFLGCVSTMCGFVNLGSALICEGINDLIHGVTCLWNSQEITLKEYMGSKLISIAISALTFGIGKCWSFGKSVYKNGLKSTWRAMELGSSVNNFFSSGKTLCKSMFNKNTLLKGWNKQGFGLIKTVVRKFTNRAVGKGISLGVNKVFGLIHPAIEKCVKDSVREKVEQMKPDLNELAKFQTSEENPLDNLIRNFTAESTNFFQTHIWQFADEISDHFASKAETKIGW
jgi:hypothetical protein